MGIVGKMRCHISWKLKMHIFLYIMYKKSWHNSCVRPFIKFHKPALSSRYLNFLNYFIVSNWMHCSVYKICLSLNLLFTLFISVQDHGVSLFQELHSSFFAVYVCWRKYSFHIIWDFDQFCHSAFKFIICDTWICILGIM